MEGFWYSYGACKADWEAGYKRGVLDVGGEGGTGYEGEYDAGV